MDEQPGKRRGRARKVVAVPDVAAEGESQSAIDAGDGQASATGVAAQAESAGQSPWLAFVGRVTEAASKRGRGFAVVFHPNPEASVIDAEWPIRVEVGEELI